MFRFSKKFVQLAMRKNEKPAIPEIILHFLEFGFITYYPFISGFNKNLLIMSMAH
ncbi:MAG: hypothetical protein WC735_00625 [Candidatus Paceibacterota bacterium]